LKEKDYGASFEIETICFNPFSETGFAANGNNNVFKTSDGGSSWSNIKARGSEQMRVDSLGNFYNIYVHVLRSEDDGLTWDTLSGLTNPVLNGAVSPEGRVYLAPFYSGLYRSKDRFVSVGDIQTSSELLLEQNYPNPARKQTVIEFELDRASMVRLAVYDMLGKKICEPVNNKLERGKHIINLKTEGYPSGVYFYILSANGLSVTKNMIIAR
jgi:hypothetical protein